jgi:DNA-binding response OmpR family regulator
LVEDSEDDVFFMKRALKQAGVDNPLQVVMDGQAAIDYVAGHNQYADRSQFPVPALVLLDLRLPLVPGMDVLKWIRSHSDWVGLPVVILTSSRHENDLRDAYASGANSFLVKPSESAELVAMVRSVKDYWLRLNNTPAYGPRAESRH